MCVQYVQYILLCTFMYDGSHPRILAPEGMRSRVTRYGLGTGQSVGHASGTLSKLLILSILHDLLCLQQTHSHLSSKFTILATSISA